MPEIGEIRKAKELGHNYCCNYIWSACIDCGKERWVSVGNLSKSKRCQYCGRRGRHPTRAGKLHPFWKGGRREGTGGYILIWLSPDDFFYPMANANGYVLEHRLVVAKALGRNLHRWEIVHHKGAKYPKRSIENKQDNRYPENLQLVQEMQHSQLTLLGNRITWLEKQVAEQAKRITLLEAENIVLKSEPSFSYRTD